VGKGLGESSITNINVTNVTASTKINAGFGLIGGGDLTVDRTLAVDPSVIVSVSGTGTSNHLTKFTGSPPTIGNSNITDNGIDIGINGKTTILPTAPDANYDGGTALFGVGPSPGDTFIRAASALSGINDGKDLYLQSGDSFGGAQTGAVYISAGTPGSGTQLRLTNGTYKFFAPALTIGALLDFTPIMTVDRTYSWPDSSGTILLSTTGFASPSATIGLAANNGTAITGMRSDATPALSQSIVPTWTGVHTFTARDVHNGGITNVSTALEVRLTRDTGLFVETAVLYWPRCVW